MAKSSFLFCDERKDHFKALYWDGQDYWLPYKRFENGKINWPQNQNEVQALTSKQVDWLMKDFAITPKIKDTKARNFY
ncbi:IS66 family insertion sequence element accessory protein TnpB [Lactobacillus helveticus]|uniref:IS66 family insertion sequence element accessory protein TnpB n=1 Tax=Lactobacillus helveticus TaxID=1587 RepID=UPI00345F2C56